MSKRQLKFLIGILVVSGAITVLVAVSLQGNMAYYVEVSDYLERGPGGGQGNFRVKGQVVPGTIQREPAKLGVVFEMSDGQGVMVVRYAKELPDTFVEDAEVVVEGEMTPEGVFEAHTLLAKCPSKYEPDAEGTPTPASS